jgi:hypothetical protein
MDFLSKKNMMMNIMGTLGVSSFETTGMEFWWIMEYWVKHWG